MRIHKNRQNRELFLLFREGDNYAFSVFYKSYFNDMYSYGKSIGTDTEVLKDTIQDIFYKVYSDRRNFTSQEHLKFYLLKSVRNAMIDRGRTSGRGNTDGNKVPELQFTITTTVLDSLIDEEERGALQQRVDRLLAELTDRQREAIYLRYMEELDYEEVAEILEMTVHGVRKLVSRAIGRLKQIDMGGGGGTYTADLQIIMEFFIKMGIKNRPFRFYINRLPDPYATILKIYDVRLPARCGFYRLDARACRRIGFLLEKRM